MRKTRNVLVDDVSTAGAIENLEHHECTKVLSHRISRSFGSWSAAIETHRHTEYVSNAKRHTYKYGNM